MANTQGQVKLSTTTAENSRPRMPPAPAKPAQTPTARSRSPTGKLEVMTDRVAGMIMAAAAPPATRATRSWVVPVAKAAATLATMNRTRPDMRTFLRPQRSPIAPNGRSRAARAMVYPLMIQSRSAWEAPRSWASWAWATLRPDTEATTAMRAVQAATRMNVRRRGSATSFSAGRGVSMSVGGSIGAS